MAVVQLVKRLAASAEKTARAAATASAGTTVVVMPRPEAPGDPASAQGRGKRRDLLATPVPHKWAGRPKRLF